MTDLQVAEMFYTVQGEGPNAGVPAVFLRLAGCNLRCGAVGRDLDDVDPIEDEPTEGASWICDTIPEWKEAEFTFSPEGLVNAFEDRGFAEELDRGAHLVLTGGEPTLPQHQEAFVEFMSAYVKVHERPFVEVETNGTIQPQPDFNRDVTQYNVSMKLSNSGHSEEERLKEDVIDWHCWNYFDTGGVAIDYPSCFKFVVGSEEDVEEVKYLADRYSIPDGMITLMPAGQTREQLAETYPRVAEIVKEEGWRFSPRLHVSIWNEQTGV